MTRKSIVVERQKLARLAGDVLVAYNRAIRHSLPLFYAAEIYVGIEDAALTWDELTESVESVRIDALQPFHPPVGGCCRGAAGARAAAGR